MIGGGVAPNVVPPSAMAEVLYRTVGDHAIVRDRLSEVVATWAAMEEVFVVPVVRLRTLEGLESAVFNFTTDVPFLDRWGTPLLVGPGSISVAHTADEYVDIAELEHAVDLYVELVTRLSAER